MGQLGRHPCGTDRIVQSMDDRTVASYPNSNSVWLYPELPHYLPDGRPCHDHVR